MKTRITKEGLLIPRELLGEMSEGEVEVRKESGGRFVVVADSGENGEREMAEEDPILSLGEDPVDDEVTDASANHDRYLYGGQSRVTEAFVDSGYLLALELRVDENHEKALGHWRSRKEEGLPRRGVRDALVESLL